MAIFKNLTGQRFGGLALLLAAILAGQSACSAADKQRELGGVGVALNCEAEALQPLVAELLPFAIDAVMSYLSPDGKSVDKTKLSAAASGLKTAQGRCALATAVAVLATPTPVQPGAPMAAGLEINGDALRKAFADVRLGWGVHGIRTKAGVL